jgi:hypothetical protein
LITKSEQLEWRRSKVVEMRSRGLSQIEISHKLQAMELFKDTHLVKLELLSNATTIDSALNFIRTKQSQQEQKKEHESNLDSQSDDDSGEQLTTGTQTVF